MLHAKMQNYYVGVDSHKDTHYAFVLNCFSEKVTEIEFSNVPSAFPSFLVKIKKFLLPEMSFVFGFEDVSEYGVSLAKYLIEQGYTIKHVNSSLVAAERQSLNTLHKTDSFDSQCAGRVLIAKFDQLPVVKPKDDYIRLNLLVTKRNYLVKNVSGIKRELQRLISKNYPSYRKYFSSVDSITALAFFEQYPSPETLKDKDVQDIVDLFTKKGHISKKEERASLILDSIEKDGDTKQEYQDTSDFIITSLIRQIRNAKNEIDLLDEKIQEVLETIPQKLQTIKGISTTTAALLLAEIGDVTRFKSPSKLARYAGVSPVTFSSGKSMVQFANEKGNRRLSGIFFMLAVVVCGAAGKHRKLVNPVFHRYYQKKISEGKTKKQALKCVQRRLVNIVWNMLKHNTEYINPEPEFLDTVQEENSVAP